jgi:hypothetical protein
LRRFIIWLTLLSLYTDAAEPSQHLVERAFNFELEKSAVWSGLNHYKQGAFGVTSEIEAQEFFISPLGRYNPASELAATIEKCFSSSPEESIKYQRKYPARYFWLCKELGADYSLHSIDGENRHQNHDTAELLFAATSFSEVSSTMGHVFLRLRDAKDTSGIDSLCISFEANVNSRTTAALIWKGIFGGYQGYYNKSSYHHKCKEYKDKTGRDIYAFRLKATKRGVDLLKLHLIEIDKIPFDYNYLIKNCANAMVPFIKILSGQNLSRRNAKPWNTPVDLVSTLSADELAAFHGIDYAAYGGLLKKYQKLSRRDKKALFEVVNGKPQSENTLTPELSELVLLYGVLKYETFVLDEQGLQDLASRVNKTEAEKSIDVESLSIDFSQSRPSSSANIGVAYSNSEFMVQFGLRPAASGFFDTTAFFDTGTEFEVFSIDLRASPISGVDLYSLKVLNIKSLKDYTKILKEKSWEVKIGGGSEFINSPKMNYVWNFSGGYGLAKNFFGGKAYLLPSAGFLGKDLQMTELGGQFGINIGIGPIRYDNLVFGFGSSQMYNTLASTLIFEPRFDCWYEFSRRLSSGGFFRFASTPHGLLGVDMCVGLKLFF